MNIVKIKQKCRLAVCGGLHVRAFEAGDKAAFSDEDVAEFKNFVEVLEASKPSRFYIRDGKLTTKAPSPQKKGKKETQEKV